jgi:hypothetical protein
MAADEKACERAPTACDDYPNCPCGRAWKQRPRSRTARADGADVSRSVRTVDERDPIRREE